MHDQIESAYRVLTEPTRFVDHVDWLVIENAKGSDHKHEVWIQYKVGEKVTLLRVTRKLKVIENV